MRIIKIKCFNNGKSEITNDSFHFSEENKASKVIVDFSEITNKDFYKFLDVEAADGTKDRKDFGLSKAEVVEVELTSEFTKGGYLTFSPFVTDSLSVDALKEKFAPQKITIRKTLDVSEGLTEPSGDIWFEFVASYLQKLEKKLDKQIVIDNQTIDVLATLLAKADFSEIQKLYKGHEYDPNTGIITFIAYDDTRSYLDLPLELIVSSGIYDEETYELVLVLANDDELRIPIGHVLTEMTQEINAIKTRIDNIVEGKTPVAKANVALSLETAEKLEVSDVFKVRVTALNNNEIKNKTVAEIREVANINAFQLIENASELEEFTTDTPISIRGNTVVEDNTIINSNPKLIISKSNNLFKYNSGLLPHTTGGITVNYNNDIFSIVGTATQYTITKIMTIPANTLKQGIYYLKHTILNGSVIPIVRIMDRVAQPNVTIINNNGTFTIGSNHNELVIEIATSIANTYNAQLQIQLNEGTTALPYQPYAEHEIALPDLTTQFPNGLGRLPNGVYDSVDIKRTGYNTTALKNGTWNVGGALTNTQYFFIDLTSIDFKETSSTLTNSRLMIGGIEYTRVTAAQMLTNDTPNTFSNWNTAGLLVIRVNKTTYTNTTAWKNYLATVNVEFQYQLATPINTGITLPTIPTYDGGLTVIVDNSQNEDIGEVVKSPKYQVNCEANKDYFVSAKLTDYTNAKVTNGTQVISMAKGYAKFTANANGIYWLEYVKDGINKISKVQLFDITEMGLTSKTADDLNQVLGTKFYPFGSTEETPTTFIASGDNWLKPSETYHNVVPGLNYKYVGASNVLTKFYTAEKAEISSTNALQFTTPLNCFFISYDTEDLEVALYHGDNPETKYLKYTEKEVDLTKGVQEYIAYNYGREMLDKLGFLRVAYYKDVVKQSKTNTANIEDILTRLAALEG